jgi:lipopolysaccharide heptosyltransferase III
LATAGAASESDGEMSGKRILFVTATRIGDAVLSTGLLSHLLARHPEARLTIAAGPLAAPLFREVPGLERLIAVEKKRRSLHWLALYRKVAGGCWDLVVDLRGSALAFLLIARERKAMGKGDPSLHRVKQLAGLFALDPPPAPHLWWSPRHEEAALALVPAGGPFFAVGPAANWRGKEWRAERFAELARRLGAASGPLAGARVAVMAAGHERVQALALLAAIPEGRRIDLVGKLDLLTAAALLSRASLFVGNDTGLMHIAAAAGAPTLGLFGPSPVEQYAPWGPRADFVTSEEPRAAMFPPGFDHRTTQTLMDGLSVDAAENAACRLIARISSRAA